ncbi:MAG: sigma-70 family RNA polymerase sigma factor [Gemmataceae bacterium]
MTRLAALLARSPADPRSDGALLAAFLADRDEPAFAELVRRHGRLVWGTCRRLLPDPADAEDAFQATFLVLVRRAGRLTRSGTVGPWLYRVASLTARNLRRKNARRLARTEPLSAGLNAAARPEPSSPDVDAALAGLSERERAAIVLCLLDGLTQREAADRLGLPEGTVSARVSRGLAKLRDKLGAEPTTVVVGSLVPAATAEAAVRAAVAYQLAATATPAVASLVDGVLRMFWLKKATAVGLAACLLMIAGMGIGTSIQRGNTAIAADPPPTNSVQAAKQSKPQQDPDREWYERARLLLQQRRAGLKAELSHLANAEAALKQNFDVRFGPRWQLLVSNRNTQGPFQLSEIRDGEAKSTTYFRTAKSLSEFLSRVRKGGEWPEHLELRPDPEGISPPDWAAARNAWLNAGFNPHHLFVVAIAPVTAYNIIVAVDQPALVRTASGKPIKWHERNTSSDPVVDMAISPDDPAKLRILGKRAGGVARVAMADVEGTVTEIMITVDKPKKP